MTIAGTTPRTGNFLRVRTSGHCATLRVRDTLNAQVLENTFIRSADSRPDSAALSRPYSVKVSGVQMGHCASVAARLISCFQHLHPHPLPRENGAGGLQTLDQEPETMTTLKAGTPGVAASAGRYLSPSFRRRLAYMLAGKARRSAELRARTLAVVLADHREGGAA